MTLKDHIDKIIQTIPNPKSYARSVKGNSTVFTLVEEFMLSHKIENLSEAIYCVHKEILPPKCKCGNKAVFNSFIKGYRQFCGANCPEKGKKHSNTISEYWSNNPVAKSEMLTKKEETMLSKYGVKNPIEIAEVREKMKSTNLTKYGVEYPLQNSGIQTKTKRLYARTHSSKARQPRPSQPIIKRKLTSPILLPVPIAGNQLEEIADFLKKNNIQFTRNYTGLCDTRQVDFYIKDHNLAIEFNGLYWHSERAGNKDKTYHESKFLKCRENGVQLLTIFEDEWLSRHGVIKNKIIHLCRNTTTRIGARKIDISVTTNKQEVKEFLEKFHVQGKTEGISIALVGKYKGEIVAVVTLRKCSEGHDMTRYCINNSASYPGLFSKFLTFIKKNKLCETVITFADLRWSTGDVYEKSGFTRVAELPPDYSYTDYKTREHKFNNRKQKLAVKYGVDITGKTESEIALEVGLDRIWDCGKVKYKISF